MFWKNQHFKKLKTKWYKILEKDGFEDIETECENLKQAAPNSYRQADPITRHSKLEYHLLISEGVQAGVFDDWVDKLVMTRISEGTSIKKISAELKRRGERCHRQTIRFIKRKYEDRWKIRAWKPEQLSSQRTPQKNQRLTA